VAHALSIAQAAGTANIVEWSKLSLSSLPAPVLRVTRILFDDNDHPIALEEAVLPLDRFPGLSPNGGGDVPDIMELAQRHGLSLGRASERISIVQATKDIAEHLGIATGTDVMKLDRIAETADGVPVEWRVAYRKIQAGAVYP
jgi:DNA-binding GntR family transcriptional regulator